MPHQMELGRSTDAVRFNHETLNLSTSQISFDVIIRPVSPGHVDGLKALATALDSAYTTTVTETIDVETGDMNFNIVIAPT